MSDGTSIEWADASWNPILGCDRVSPGCDRCYAIIQARIRAGNPNPKIAAAFDGLTERGEHRADWTGRVNLLPDRLAQPLGWRKPRRVFVNSLSDLFHEDVPDEFIARIFAVMAATPHHTYQILTKRHGRMRSLLSRGTLGTEGFADMVEESMAEFSHASLDEWPPPNVWLGVSAEDQHWARIRIHALLATPAAVRWVSAEPLLGPIDLRNLQMGNGALIDALHGDVKTPQGEIYAACPGSVSWVVAGGESGPGARPMHPDWARSLRDQCQAARIPFLFKQWGAWGPLAPLDSLGRFDFHGAHPMANDGTLYQPHDLTYPDGPRYGEAIGAHHDRAHLTNMYRLGKKAAGRDLDGRTWDEFPRAATGALA